MYTGPVIYKGSISTPKMRRPKLIRRKIISRRMQRRLRNLICREETLTLASLTKPFKGPIPNQGIS
jgi:hypothetical protein